MSIDAGSAFVLQFSSIGAVRTQTRATDVGRAVEGVTRQMRQARTAFSQVAGVTNQLGRVFGVNLGVQAIAGAMSGRAVSALGMGGGSNRQLERAPQAIGQLAEAVTGLAAFVGISVIQQRAQQVMQERQQRTHDRAVARAIAAQDRQQRRSTAVSRAGGAATTVGTVSTGAKVGAAFGPVGAMIGTIAAFVAAGIFSRVSGEVMAGLAQDALGTERGTFTQEHRRELDLQRLRFEGGPARRRELEFNLRRQRTMRQVERLGGSEGTFGRFRGMAEGLGDRLSGPIFPVGEGGLRLTLLPGTRTAVEKRLQELEQRIVEMENERQRQTGAILEQMRRAGRL